MPIADGDDGPVQQPDQRRAGAPQRRDDRDDQDASAGRHGQHGQGGPVRADWAGPRRRLARRVGPGVPRCTRSSCRGSRSGSAPRCPAATCRSSPGRPPRPSARPARCTRRSAWPARPATPRARPPDGAGQVRGAGEPTGGQEGQVAGGQRQHPVDVARPGPGGEPGPPRRSPRASAMPETETAVSRPGGHPVGDPVREILGHGDQGRPGRPARAGAGDRAARRRARCRRCRRPVRRPARSALRRSDPP